MLQTPLGTGDFGATYALNSNEVVKVIRILNSKSEADIHKEVTIHKEAQNLRIEGMACVPMILDMPETHVVENERYITYSMPKLQKFRATKANYAIIIKLNAYLVKNGFLHNDLHQGNVMMTKEGTPIIIDLGLVRMFAPPKDEDLCRCIAFAQAAALVDNCNTNTKCPLQNIKSLLDEDVSYVTDLFQLRSRDTVPMMLQRIEAKVDSNHSYETLLQLLLACLCTHFQPCPSAEDAWIGAICTPGNMISDFIYAIRDPTLFRTNLSNLYTMAKNGELYSPEIEAH